MPCFSQTRHCARKAIRLDEKVVSSITAHHQHTDRCGGEATGNLGSYANLVERQLILDEDASPAGFHLFKISDLIA